MASVCALLWLCWLRLVPSAAPRAPVPRSRAQVPLGSVTPLAIAQPSAAGVALLLDGKLRGQPRICVHPLDNTATMVLSSEGLEAFVRWARVGSSGARPAAACSAPEPRSLLALQARRPASGRAGPSGPLACSAAGDPEGAAAVAALRAGRLGASRPGWTWRLIR